MSAAKGIVPVGKFNLLPVGLTAVDGAKPTYAQWEIFLNDLVSAHQRLPFWIGDCLNYGEHHYGETYSQALDATGLAQETLANYKSVCARVEISLRNEHLTFSHHALVSPLEPPDQKKWLTLAANNGWTVAELRQAMRGNDEEDAADAETDGDDLADVVKTVTDFLETLADDGERLVAVRTLEKRLRGLEKRYAA